MKNIHTIQTNEPSRLHLWNDGTNKKFELCDLDFSHTIDTYHLYITSNELPKHGEFCINKYNTIDFYWMELRRNDFKPIILTTDLKLISHGIQAIDEDFLQWFVNNQTVEYVEAGIYGSRYIPILPPTTVEPVEQGNVKEFAESYVNKQTIDFGDLNHVAEHQIKQDFLCGATQVKKQIPAIIKQFLSQHQNDYLLNHVDTWCRENIK